MGKVVPFRPRGSATSAPTDETTSFEGPSRIHTRDWASSFTLSVAWLAERSSTPSLVRGEGTILLRGMTNDAGGQPIVRSHGVGQMSVVKACLATGEDLEAAFTAESERHAQLAEDVFDRYRFSEEFETWCEEEHGQHPLEDPLFLVDLRLDRDVLDDLAGDRAKTHAVPLDEWVAAMAAIDALAVLGAVGSPFVAFGHATRSHAPRSWLEALNAKPWRPDLFVGFRPDP
jgi:hypothetical protein